MVFDRIIRAARKGARRFGRLLGLSPSGTSGRDLQRTMPEYRVKQKLGASFFTRQLNPNVRAARIMSLTNAEYELAVEKGWL